MTMVASKSPTDYTPIKFTAEQRVVIAYWLRELDKAFLAGDFEAVGMTSNKLQSFLGERTKRTHKAPHGGRWPSHLRALKPEQVIEMRKRHKEGQSVASIAREYRIYSYGAILGAVMGITYKDVPLE